MLYSLSMGNISTEITAEQGWSQLRVYSSDKYVDADIIPGQALSGAVCLINLRYGERKKRKENQGKKGCIIVCHVDTMYYSCIAYLEILNGYLLYISLQMAASTPYVDYVLKLSSLQSNFQSNIYGWIELEGFKPSIKRRLAI